MREKDRLVFKIDGELLRIVQCGTHYGDYSAHVLRLTLPALPPKNPEIPATASAALNWKP